MRITTLLAITLMLTACSPKTRDCAPCAPAPQLVSITLIDRNGMTETVSNIERLKQYRNLNFLTNQPFEKVLRVYGRNNEGNICSFLTSYHPNGQPKQYLEIVNSRAFGAYKEWHENGCNKLETKVVGGEADLTDRCGN